MRKTTLAAALLVLPLMATVRPSSGQVAIDVDKPGFSLHAGPPVYRPPVVVAPPAVVYRPPVYYYPRPPKHYWKHWKHWDKHHGHHHHHGDWD